MRPKVIIAEDHQLLRDGLRMLLCAETDCEIVAETSDGTAVEGLIELHQPSLLILDIGLPGRNGIDIARQIKSRFQTVAVLVLTGDSKTDSVRRALAAGADGYVLKGNDTSEIVSAIHAVLKGKTYVGYHLAKSFRENCEVISIESKRITPREKEILWMIADGSSNQKIAEALCISHDTVRTHRKNAMEKLDLHNAAEITAYVINHQATSKSTSNSKSS